MFRMRIAVYSHYFLPEIGAPSARIGDFASQWLKSGHEVHVATCFPNHPTGRIYQGYQLGWYQHEVLQGINVHRSWTYITPNTGTIRKSIGHASLWISAGMWSTRKMSVPNCTIGTSPTLFAAMAARASARRNQVPFIMEVRDLWPAIFVDLGVIRNRALIRLLERWEMNLYHSATRIVTVTEAFRQNLLTRGIEPNKVATITNGADTDYWQPVMDSAAKLRAELGLQDAFVVLYIGAHGISQGLTVLLKAAERLQSDPRVQFLFVGEGADKEKLVGEAARLGLKNVRFIAPVNKAKVREYYSMADLCLVPLRNIPLFDTFIPSKMFEVMSVGRPIVASLGGEAAQILQQSGGAVVVPPEDDAAVAAAVLELRRDPVRRAAMGRQGRDFTQSNYSRAILAQRYERVVEDAVASFGKRRR
jgi:glycosyltransferase involved in cell wall biosynthesis